jgi:hypothetical protein
MHNFWWKDKKRWWTNHHPFKKFGEEIPKKGDTGIEPVTSTSKHQKLNHLRPWVFYAYKLFYIP